MSSSELHLDFRSADPSVEDDGSSITVKFTDLGSHTTLYLGLDHYSAVSLMWGLQDALRKAGAA